MILIYSKRPPTNTLTWGIFPFLKKGLSKSVALLQRKIGLTITGTYYRNAPDPFHWRNKESLNRKMPKLLFNKTVWMDFRILSTLGFSAAMTHHFNYLLACAGWRAASHEQEDHLQSWLAATAPSPGRQKGLLWSTETKKTGGMWIDAGGSSYIVNIVYTALFLIVLFERAVTVEFPETHKKGSVVLFRWHFRFHTLNHFDSVENGWRCTHLSFPVPSYLMMLSSICMRDVAV